MGNGSGVLVFYILVPLFAGVGLYLIWYSRRRKKMLEAFAGNHRLRIRPELGEGVQKRLDRSFSLKQEGLVRSFGQLSSLVDGGSIWLFRAVELLDLNPHAQSCSTHFTRVVALFDVPTGRNEFFVLDQTLPQVRPMLPGKYRPSPEVVQATRRIAGSHHARHPLSLTLSRSCGLIYFEPLVTGGETIHDVNALYGIARDLREELAGRADLPEMPPE